MDTSPPPVAAVYLSGRLTFFFLLASSPFPFNPSDLTEPYLHGRVSGYRGEGEGETFPIADVFVSFKAEWKNGRRLHPAVTIISWLFLLWPPAILDPTISSVSVFADTDVARFLLNWSASLLSLRREDTLRGANVGRNVV